MPNISYEALARLIAEAKDDHRNNPQAYKALSHLAWSIADYATTARHELDLDKFLAATRLPL